MKTYVLQLVSLGNVPLASGHSITPETLEPCIGMVNDSGLIVYSKNELIFRGSLVTFFLLPQASCKMCT